MKNLKTAFVLTLLISTSNLVASKDTTVEIQRFFGTVTWQAGTGEKKVVCLAKNVEPDSSGKFEWRLDGEIVDSSDDRFEVEDDEFENTLEYEPTIADDKKALSCSYLTLDEFGDVIHSVESTPINIRVESHKFPKSPFQAGSYQSGQPISFSIEFEQYPHPKPDNVVWVVKGPEGKATEMKPGMKAVSNKYQAGELKNLGNNKFSTSLTITSADAEEVEKEHFLLVRGADAARSEHKVEIKFEISDREPAPTTATTTTTTAEEGETEAPPAQLNVGIIIILVLVILIIIICIGYCIYKKYGKKPEPREPAAQPGPDAKGEYRQAPTKDPEAP